MKLAFKILVIKLNTVVLFLQNEVWAKINFTAIFLFFTDKKFLKFDDFYYKNLCYNCFFLQYLSVIELKK